MDMLSIGVGVLASLITFSITEPISIYLKIRYLDKRKLELNAWENELRIRERNLQTKESEKMLTKIEK